MRGVRGPWRLVRGAPGQPPAPLGCIVCYVGTDPEDRAWWVVAASPDDHGPPAADGQLLAAAPALLDACRAALPVLVGYHCSLGDYPLPRNAWLPTVIRQLRAAMALAEGQEAAAAAAVADA